MDGSWKIPAKDVIGEIVNNHKSFTIKKSPFFENITKSIKTKGWVDIEMEYYKRLKEYVRQDMNYHSLNKQLHFLQNKLVQYLETQKIATKNNAIDNYLYSSISLDDLCVNARYLDRKIDSFMFLSFNYTDTVELYTSLNTKINYIHGSLYNPEEIIFGYGDELDKDYQNIIDMNDNELLRYVKSVKYLEALDKRGVK